MVCFVGVELVVVHMVVHFDQISTFVEGQVFVTLPTLIGFSRIRGSPHGGRAGVLTKSTSSSKVKFLQLRLLRSDFGS